MAATPETKTKNKIKAWLKKRGVFYWAAVAGPRAINGVSDILALHNGTFYALEVKRPGCRHKATESQKIFIANIVKHGGIGVVIDDVEQLEEIFDADTTRNAGSRVEAETPRQGNHSDTRGPSGRGGRSKDNARPT